MAAGKKATFFIHGLHWTVGSRKLMEYFMKFGPVEYCHVKFDYASGFSKGYAFVDLKNQEDALKVLNEPNHVLMKPFFVRKSFNDQGEDPKAEE